MATGSSQTPWTSLIMPPCSPDFLVSSMEATVQPSRRQNRARSLRVIAVDDAATPMAGNNGYPRRQRCARARAGGSARARQQLNQGARPDVEVSYSENPTEHSERGACHARRSLGLTPPPPIHRTGKEHAMRDGHWG